MDIFVYQYEEGIQWHHLVAIRGYYDSYAAIYFLKYQIYTYFLKIGSDEQSWKYWRDFRILTQKWIHILKVEGLSLLLI